MVKARANKQLNNTIKKVEHEFRRSKPDSDAQFMWLRITDTDEQEFEYEFGSLGGMMIELLGPRLIEAFEAAIKDLSKVVIGEDKDMTLLWVEVKGHLKLTECNGLRLKAK
ncbi:hypothetical protein [Comamonas sp.]|uniref:hypothetical protein n=1 Tax=Comamonas sp. TaxID=34028 RepID=UPI0028A2CDF0|nr:hypothetical protein [Comamonas sp.]